MLNFLTIPSESDLAANLVYRRLLEHFDSTEGVCYYKHAIARTRNGIFPDFTVFTKTYHPLVIKIVPNQIQEIQHVEDEIWCVNDAVIHSPFIDIEDLSIIIDNQFRQERALRNLIRPQAILALPFITKKDFLEKFGNLNENIFVLWSGNNTQIFNQPIQRPLSDKEWTLTRAVIQGATHLYKPTKDILVNVSSLNDAIRELDKNIAALDDEQEAAVVKIAPGPQRIRGLAGTGKTVLLALKAALIHYQYPDKKILFTFNTQSLYNQTRDLITKAYRSRIGEDPNWDLLHIRHAWGGKNKPGVYSDVCASQGRNSLNYNDVRKYPHPFKKCCIHALEMPIYLTYDYILVDEAQDFPQEFFSVLYKLSRPSHCIYWAYDELQSLSSLEIPKPEDLFGRDKFGQPLVTLEGEYPENIEKDIVLYKSYRCPLPILMLAHGIGLGIKNPKGCVQMLENKGDWEAVGYSIESGNLQQGEDVVIFRDSKYSPNRIFDIYSQQQLITTKVFQDKDLELSWVAESIQKDVKDEKVAPHKIVVISLDNQAKSSFETLRKKLACNGIASIAPGIFTEDPSSSFAIMDKVTLSTVYKAKGNETYIVYIIGFDALYNYVDGIGNRNKAFASITRSKAWVRITGTGRNMEYAKEEINSIIEDIPYFKFKFPDIKMIRRLGAENSKRKRTADKVDKSATMLIKVDEEALASVDLEKLKTLQEKVSKAIQEKS